MTTDKTRIIGVSERGLQEAVNHMASPLVQGAIEPWLSPTAKYEPPPSVAPTQTRHFEVWLRPCKRDSGVLLELIWTVTYFTFSVYK